MLHLTDRWLHVVADARRASVDDVAVSAARKARRDIGGFLLHSLAGIGFAFYGAVRFLVVGVPRDVRSVLQVCSVATAVLRYLTLAGATLACSHDALWRHGAVYATLYGNAATSAIADVAILTLGFQNVPVWTLVDPLLATGLLATLITVEEERIHTKPSAAALAAAALSGSWLLLLPAAVVNLPIEAAVPWLASACFASATVLLRHNSGAQVLALGFSVAAREVGIQLTV